MDHVVRTTDKEEEVFRMEFVVKLLSLICLAQNHDFRKQNKEVDLFRFELSSKVHNHNVLMWEPLCSNPNIRESGCVQIEVSF